MKAPRNVIRRRSEATRAAIAACPACLDGNGRVQLCAAHRCTAWTQYGHRCRNAISHPQASACGIHTEQENRSR